jgi:hypothetical protein
MNETMVFEYDVDDDDDDDDGLCGLVWCDTLWCGGLGEAEREQPDQSTSQATDNALHSSRDAVSQVPIPRHLRD